MATTTPTIAELYKQYGLDPYEDVGETPGFVSSNLKKGTATLGTALGGLGKFVGAEETGQKLVDYSKGKAAEYEKARPSLRLKDIDGVGSALQFAGEQALQMAPLALTALPLAAGGGALGAAAGLGRAGITASTLGGAAVGSIGTEAGIISSDIKPGELTGNRGRVMEYAIPAGLLEVIPELIGAKVTGLGSKLISTIGKKYGTDVAEEVAQTAAKGGWLRTAGKTAGGIALTSAGEGMTESAQSPLEAAGAGKQVFRDGKSFGDDPLKNTLGAFTGGLVGGENYTPEMQGEMLESLAAGAAGGFGMTSAGHVVNKGLDFISDKKTETSLTNGQTQDSPQYQIYNEQTAADYTWTAEDVVRQTTPEAQEGVRQRIAAQEAQAAYEQTPEGMQEKEEQERQEWRTNLIDSTNGMYEGRKGIDGIYKNLKSFLESPDAMESAIRRGVETEESIAQKQRQLGWIESDPTFQARVPTLAKEIEKRETDRQKRQEEYNKIIDDFNADLDDLNTKIKEEEDALKKKKLRRERDELEATHDADLIEFQKSGAQDMEGSIPTGFDPDLTYSVDRETGAMVERTSGPVEVASGPTAISGLELTKNETPVALRKLSVYNEANKTNLTLKDVEFKHNAETRDYDVTPIAKEEKEETGAAGISKDKKKVKKETKPTKVEKPAPAKVATPAPSTPKRKPGLTKKKDKIAPTDSLEEMTKTVEDNLFEKKEEVDQRTNKEAFKSDDVTKLVEHMLGPKARVEVIDNDYIHVVRPDGKLIKVPAAFIRDTIVVAGGHKTLYENVRHETIHAAKAMGLFTEQEWKILNVKAIKWMKEFNIRERYKGLTEEQLREEAIARAFEARPTDNGLFTKLKNFLTKILNFVSGRGYDSVNTIFDKLESGQFASRSISSAQEIPSILASMSEQDLEEHIGDLFDKFTHTLDGKTTPQKIRKRYISDLKKFKNEPKSMQVQKLLLTANAVNTSEFQPNELFFKNDRTISFEQFQEIPKAERVTYFMEHIAPKAKNSLLYSLYKENQKISAKGKLTPKEQGKQIAWNTLKKALESGIYYDGSETSFHARLSYAHNESLTARDWDEDSAIFAFMHTGYSDASLVPELFLPKAEVFGVTRSKLALEGKVEGAHVLFPDALKRSMLNNYRYLTGLDMDPHGMLGTPIVDLAKESKLVKDIIDIASTGNIGSIIKLSDYKEAKDRNIVSMGVINYLERIGAILVQDIDTRGGDTLKREKHTGDIYVQQHMDSTRKARRSIYEFLNDVTTRKNEDKSIEQIIDNENTFTESLARDVSLGNTYIGFNPEFFEIYAALASKEASTQMTIDVMINGKRTVIRSSAISYLDSLVNEEDRTKIFNAIKITNGNSETLMKYLVDIALNNFEKKWQVSRNDTLDNSLMKAIHKHGESDMGSSAKMIAKLDRNRFNDIGEVRTINGFKMNIPYSAALYLTAEDAFKTFTKSFSTNQKFNEKTGMKEYKSAGEAKLLKAVQAVLLHRMHFDSPLYGKFDNIVSAAVDFFNGNGNIIDKITKETVFPKKKHTIDDKTFSALTPAITGILLQEMGIVTKFGLPETSEERPSLIQRLEKTIDVQSDLSSSYKSVSDLMDSILEEPEAGLVSEEEVVQDTEGLTVVEDKEEDEDTDLEGDEEEVAKSRVKKRSPKEEREYRALGKFLTMLKKRNKDATTVIASSALRKQVQSIPEVLERAAKVKDINAFFTEEYAKYASMQYDLLIKKVEALRDSDTMTPEDRVEATEDIKELSKTLGVDFIMKDVSIPRDVRINLGTIFDRYGDEWSAEQKAEMVARLKPLIRELIWTHSRRLSGSKVIGDGKLGLQVYEDTTSSGTGQKFHYLNIAVAEDIESVDPEDYRGPAVAYKATFDETKYDAKGHRVKSVYEMAEDEAENELKIKEEKDSAIAKLPKFGGVELGKRYKALKERNVEEKRIAEIHKIGRMAIIHYNTRKFLESRWPKEAQAAKELTESLIPNTPINETAYSLVYKTIFELASRKELSTYNISRKSDLSNMETWTKFIEDINAEVKHRLDALSTDGQTWSLDQATNRITFTPVPAKFDLETLKAELTHAITEYVGTIQMNGTIVQDVLAEYDINNAVRHEDTAIPVGSLFTEKKSKMSYRVIPTSFGKDGNKWVQFEAVDLAGKRIGGTRTMFKAEFLKKFIRNTKPVAKETHDKARYNQQFAQEIDAMVTRWGIKMKPIVQHMIDFFAAHSGIPFTQGQILMYITEGNKQLGFDKAWFEKSGFKDAIEFKYMLNEGLLSQLEKDGFIIETKNDKGKLAYVPSKKLVEFYQGLTLGSASKAKLDVTEAVDSFREKFSDPASMVKQIKRFVQGVSETQIFGFVKNLFATPWREAKAHPILKHIMLLAGARAEKRESWVESFSRTIDATFTELKELATSDPATHQLIHQLVMLGDKTKTVYKTLQEAQQAIGGITAKAFNAYTKLQDSLPALREITYNAGAHMYMEWANVRFNKEHDFTKILMDEIVTKKKDVEDREVLNGITDRLLLQIAPDKRVVTRKEMRRAVRGFGEWYNKKRTNIMNTPGWMPRIRFANKFIGLVKDDKDENVAFRYFAKSAQAEDWLKSYKDKGLKTSVAEASPEMRHLYTTMDEIRDFSNLESFLSNGFATDNNQPHFGVSILEDEESGGKHLSRRVGNVVEGYEDTNYIMNYLTAVNRMANSFAQLQYGLGQRELLQQAREEAKTDLTLAKLLPKFVAHVKYELGPASPLDFATGIARNAAVFTFMAFRVLPAIINSTQPFTVGVPLLAKVISDIKKDGTYFGNLGHATKLMRNGIGDAIIDFKETTLKNEKTHIGKAIAKLLDAATSKSNIQGSGNLSSADKEALEQYHKYNIGKQSIQSSVTLMDDYRERMIAMRHSELDAKMSWAMDEGMSFMRLTEQLNRAGSFLAAYRLFSNNSAEYDVNAAEKAAEFVYDSQFMVNGMNMPLSIKQMGPLGKTIMTLSMYPIHYLNTIYSTMGNANGAKTLLLMALFAVMLGGVGAMPGVDLLKWLYNQMSGGNATIDLIKLGKTLGMPDGATNAFLRGFPTLAGVDIASNVAMPTPYIGGLIAGNTPIESATGASGAIIKRVYDAMTLAKKGELGQAISEKLAPEAIASRFRAYRQYKEGMTTSTGMPQQYQGKNLKYDLEDFMKAMVEIKSSDMGTIQEKRYAIKQLEQKYKVAASFAQEYYRKHDNIKLIQKFNRDIVKHKLMPLVKPIKPAKIPKEPKGRTGYENILETD